MSSSFAWMATVTASTKRRGMTDGKETAPAVNIASLKCLPLDPVSPMMVQSISGLRFHELLQTQVEGGLDIKKGDILVVGTNEYPIRAAEKWNWRPDSTDFLLLYLENKE